MHNRYKGYIRYFISTQRKQINPLKPEINPYNIYKFSFYLAENTPHFHYKDQSDNTARGIIGIYSENRTENEVQCVYEMQSSLLLKGMGHTVFQNFQIRH
jgi:hypothetical protein